MAAAVIQLTKGLLFLIASASGILSLYAAVNAVSVFTNHSVFVSGLAVLLIGIGVGPLFCFIAGYGFVRYLDVPISEAFFLTAPIFLAWCFMAFRVLAGLVGAR